jgi:hypothetical protein
MLGRWNVTESQKSTLERTVSGASRERLFPFAGALLAGGACWFLAVPFPDKARDLFPATLSAAAIGAGFLTTTKAILLSVDHRWVVQRAKESGAYLNLVNFIIHATWMCLLLASTSALMTLVPASPVPVWARPTFCLWAALGVWAALAVFRVLHILAFLLRMLAESPE